ncbi:MAG: transposase [Caldisphaeraceae archaeon]|nr:transposase [Caldisphaeraceae archaeon]
MRELYPKLPSHYVYTSCQDASTRAKSFIKLKKLSLAKKDYPEVRRIIIWLDDHLWKTSSLTLIKRDKQLRHRIFQASLKGIQKAIEEKSKEYGISIIYINPKNTSKLCPIHSATITYSNGSRIGRCSKGKEMWHRDAVATWNLYLRILRGDGSDAPSPLKHRFVPPCHWARLPPMTPCCQAFAQRVTSSMMNSLNILKHLNNKSI